MSQETRSEPVPEGILESGIWVFQSDHDLSFSMSSSRHHFPELLYFREGRGHIEFNSAVIARQRIPCFPGQCVVVPAYADHVIEDESGSPLSLYGLAIDPKRIPVCAGLETLLPTGSIPRQRVLLLDIEQRLRRLLYLGANAAPAAKLTAVAAAIELFALIAQSGGACDPQSAGFTERSDEIDEYLGWLHSNFFEPVTLDQAAIACDCSPTKVHGNVQAKDGEYLVKVSAWSTDQTRSKTSRRN